METKYSDKLNTILATYQIHYQNLRSLHWNIKGERFFELHLKYEELYTRAQVIIDDIAERLLVLEITPISSFSGYLKAAKLDENDIISDGKTGMKYVLKAQQILLKLEKEVFDLAAEAEDEGTSAMLSDLIREKEKTNWMFKAWINE